MHKVKKYLPDVNVLIALLTEDHIHHEIAVKWFDSLMMDDEFCVCAFTEVGFLRAASNPKTGSHSFDAVLKAWTSLSKRGCYRYWMVTESWNTLASPFIWRIFGHRQITDAYLLGLAVWEGGVLVTMDKEIQFLAGDKHRKNVLLLK